MTDGSYWVYGYDALGQLTGANKYFWDGTPVAGQQFGYTFDTIGNRTATQIGGIRTGGISGRLVTRILCSIRSAAAGAWVCGRDGLDAGDEHGERERQQCVSEMGVFLEAGRDEQCQRRAMVGDQRDGAGADAGVGESFCGEEPGDIHLRPGWESDQRRAFWLHLGRENRLLNMTSLSGAPTASQYTLDFTSDYMGRRIQKIVSTNNGSSWITSYTEKYVYDWWNVVAILDGSNNLLYSFNWGLDLSGSMQGAGGVGGAISMTVYSGPNAGTYYYCYDGNGNVVALVNAANGSVAANWDTAPSANSSAPPAHGEGQPLHVLHQVLRLGDGLYYYGYRYCNPPLEDGYPETQLVSGVA